jgi:peptidyl-dipeptidase Dcp
MNQKQLSFFNKLILILLSLILGACMTQPTQSNEQLSQNPLLKPWTGPYGGVPAFDQVTVTDFKPALLAAISEARNNYLNITNQAEAPTFENTILPLEKATDTLQRVTAIYGVYGSSLVTPEFQKIQTEMSVVLSNFKDEYIQNEKLFNRVKKIYDNREKAQSAGQLSSEQKRLVWVIYNNFVRYGALLTAAQKNELQKVNQRMAEVTNLFKNNLLNDEDNKFISITDQNDISGLPSWLADSAKAEADRRGLKNQWVISNTRSAMEPFLTYCNNRALREKAFRLWTGRGEGQNESVITEILELRQKSAKILGFKNYSEWRMSNTMAKNPKLAEELILKVWTPAVKKFKHDISELQKIVDQEKGGFKIQAWDYRFYEEKYLKAQYDFNAEDLKPYLQLDHLLKGLFWTAKKLYGFNFVKIEDHENIPVFHKDVTVYKVLKGGPSSSQFVGLWYFDLFARPGKSSGAWMDSYRDQFQLNGQNITPIVSNNSNFMKPAAGKSALLSWDDAVTLFHEFGHGLHGLSSNVNYRSLSGTNTTLDFVELPSQLHEHFLMTPEVLNFLQNEKGEKISKDLLKKMKASTDFSVGFNSVEFSSSALFDIKVHQMTEPPKDIAQFEKTFLNEIHMPNEIVMRHRPTQFGHLFTGESYASGYYAYLWADVLTKDAFGAFEEQKEIYSPKAADSYFKNILSVGNSIDPEQAYRNFRGRNPDEKALLKSRGFLK